LPVPGWVQVKCARAPIAACAAKRLTGRERWECLAGITMTNPSAAGPLFGVHGRSEPKIGDNIVAALPQFSLKCAYAAICAFLPKKAPHCVDSIWQRCA
jgi:hypothetical protein